MAKRIGGFRRKTRGKLSKPAKAKGKLSLTKFFQTFKEGDRVFLSAEPAYQKGLYFPRFHGKSGVVLGQKGRCYEIEIKDFRKKKTLVVHPAHLKRCV
ncbi:50S ribosomal protein L21e [Nanoarchaeota archaeon]